MITIHLDQDGYRHSTSEDQWAGRHVGYMPLIVDAARALLDLRDKAEAYATSDDPLLKYIESYPYGILIEVGGVPAGVVRMVDDSPVYEEFRQTNIEESK